MEHSYRLALLLDVCYLFPMPHFKLKCMGKSIFIFIFYGVIKHIIIAKFVIIDLILLLLSLLKMVLFCINAINCMDNYDIIKECFFYIPFMLKRFVICSAFKIHIIDNCNMKKKQVYLIASAGTELYNKTTVLGANF